MKMDMEQDALRQSLLTELIDKMHGRLADKMFPPDSNAIPMPDHNQGDLPAASDIPDSMAEASISDGAGVETHGDDAGDTTGIPDEDGMTDEDLDEMMKGM
jgi:hypothetical protein